MIQPTAQDTIEALSAAIDAALADDVLVFSGGSSVGERDLILDALLKRGEVLFHGVAVKPGKPTVFGQVARQARARDAGISDVVPVERLHAAGADAAPDGAAAGTSRAKRARPARAAQSSRPLAGTSSIRCRIADGSAVPAFKGSGDITSMSHADGYIEIPAHVDIVEAGELVEVKLF